MGKVIEVDFGRSKEIAMTKKQLSQHREIRRSTRWVEMRVAEGMPSWLDGHRRMFRLSEVRAWLGKHGFQPGASGPPMQRADDDDQPDPDDAAEEGNRQAAEREPVIA